jgi:hypothetical protein
VSGRDSQACRGVDSSLTCELANVSALNAPVGGAGREAAACDILERDENSLEGALSSRSRRDLARGGVQPPSEAESRSRGCPAPERGGTSLEGATGSRARQSFTSAAPRPLSEAEFRLRVAGPTVWWVVGPWVYLARVVRFVLRLFFMKVSGFSLVV